MNVLPPENPPPQPNGPTSRSSKSTKDLSPIPRKTAEKTREAVVQTPVNTDTEPTTILPSSRSQPSFVQANVSEVSLEQQMPLSLEEGGAGNTRLNESSFLKKGSEVESFRSTVSSLPTELRGIPSLYYAIKIIKKEHGKLIESKEGPTDLAHSPGSKGIVRKLAERFQRIGSSEESRQSAAKALCLIKDFMVSCQELPKEGTLREKNISMLRQSLTDLVSTEWFRGVLHHHPEISIQVLQTARTLYPPQDRESVAEIEKILIALRGFERFDTQDKAITNQLLEEFKKIFTKLPPEDQKKLLPAIKNRQITDVVWRATHQG